MRGPIHPALPHGIVFPAAPFICRKSNPGDSAPCYNAQTTLRDHSCSYRLLAMLPEGARLVTKKKTLRLGSRSPDDPISGIGRAFATAFSRALRVIPRHLAARELTRRQHTRKSDHAQKSRFNTLSELRASLLGLHVLQVRRQTYVS